MLLISSCDEHFSIVKEPQGGITWELWKKYNQEKFLNTPENIVKYWNEYFVSLSMNPT